LLKKINKIKNNKSEKMIIDNIEDLIKNEKQEMLDKPLIKKPEKMLEDFENFSNYVIYKTYGRNLKIKDLKK
jgi:hypothetical protein